MEGIWDTLEKEALGRHKLMEEAKLEVIPEWEEAAPYVNKRRTQYNPEDNKSRNPSSPNRDVKKKTYSSQPALMAQTMATMFQGLTISPASRWFGLGPEDHSYDDIPLIGDWLDAVETDLYKVFRTSKFYDAANEYILDALTIGTACMWVEEAKNLSGIRFTTRHMREIFISETEEEVDMISRVFNKTGRELIAKEKDDGWVLPDKLRNTCERNPESLHQIVHFVAPMGQLYNEPTSRRDYPYMYLYPGEGPTILYQHGYYEFPAFIWRWRKNSGELYGRGQATEYIESIKRFDLIAKSLLGLDQKLGDPPRNTPHSLREQGGAKLLPRYDNYYKADGLRTEIIDLSAGHRPLMDDYEMAKQEVSETFLIPFLLMFYQQDREMTAYEVSERTRENSNIISNVVGRLYNEFLNPMINRVIAIRQRQGLLPKMPPPLDKAVEGMVPKVEMLGPFAMAQQQFHEGRGIEQGIVRLREIATLDPKVLHVPDLIGATKDLLSTTGFPEKRIREDEEIVQRIQAEAEAMKKQQAMQEAQVNADVMQKTKDAPEPGSPADAAMQAAGATAQNATSR